MKTVLLAAILLASSAGVAQEQGKSEDDACKFTVLEDLTVPSVTGQENLTRLVYVVDQPDSPIKIVSVDLEGMWLSVSNNRFTAHDCARYQVRNRSNKAIRFVEVILGVNDRFSFGAMSREPISSGQTVELKACSGGGSGYAQENSVKLFVSVHSVGFADCMYRPSVRIPRTLGVQPVW